MSFLNNTGHTEPTGSHVDHDGSYFPSLMRVPKPANDTYMSDAVLALLATQHKKFVERTQVIPDQKPRGDIYATGIKNII